jgi:hypothetical protein
MPHVTSALVSLLPLAGAVALTVQGLRRRTRATAGDSRVASQPPQPIEPPAPPARARRAAAPDSTCAGCGTSIPARTTHCATCDRTIAGQEHSSWTTVLHWLVFIAVMSAIIGTGWFLSP